MAGKFLLLLFLFNAVFLSSVFAGAYARTITGTVTDVDNSQPLVGATVRVKESPKGAITDARGRFSINIDDSDKTLVVSYTGYETIEVAIGSNSAFTITMSPSASSLDQIVVVGYGTQKKSSLTGAISQVTSREMSALPVADVRQALQGRAPAVSVVNNGSPGEDPIIRIRGIGSVNFASNPLYVVDGLPMGDLATIDTRDVESVEVLKDAAATAIYGSRGTNGVIMITTKKGTRDGGLNVSLESYYGSQTAWRQLDLLNRDQYMQYATALRAGAGEKPPARFAKMNEPIYAGATQTYAQTDTDWQDEMFQTAGVTQTNLSVSTGNEKSRLFVGLGYFNQDGIMLGTKYQRYNMRINYDYKIGKRITIGQNLSLGSDYRLNENNGGGRTQLKHILHMTPYIPVEDPTQPGGYRGPSGDDSSDPQNPVRLALQDLNRNSRFRLISTAFADVELFKGLNYRFTAGIEYTSFINRINNPIYNESFNARAFNRVEQNRFTGTSPYFSNQLTFDKTFGKHTVNIIAVAERQDGNFSQMQAGGQYPTNELRQLSSGMTDASVNGFTDKTVLYSYIGRLNYEFGGKYLFSASVRRDGSSIFAPGKKWGNFPAISAGWRLSEENFLKDNKYISELKLRGSYGSTGFNAINNYGWQPVLLQNTAAVFGADARVQGTYFDRLGNTDLAWEITRMSNIGLDLGLFDNRLTFQAEYYNRETSIEGNGLILNQQPAPSLGFSAPTPANVGLMRNTGWEFQAGYRKVKGDFRWNLNANIGWVNNMVESFGPDITTPFFDGGNADYGGDAITVTRPGTPIQTFFGWQVDGIFQNQSEIDRLNAIDGDDKTAFQSSATKPGDIRFKDIDGNGVINTLDRVELGSFLPKFSYGANLDLNYKNFDVTMFLQGVQGNKIYNGTKVLRQGMLRLFNAGTEVLNAWTPQNTNTDIPRAVEGDPNRNSRTSDRFLEDGSYLRIKNLTVGYTLPASALNNITRGGVSRLRIYVSSQNLLTITRYTGYDPEIGSRFNGTLTNGIDYGQFPAARTILGGIQVGF